MSNPTPRHAIPGVNLSSKTSSPLFPLLDESLDPCTEDPAALIIAAAAIFEQTGCVTLCELSPVLLRNFLCAARHSYRPHGYHGWYHGVHVMLNCYRLLRGAHASLRLTPAELTALFLAAICHDSDHPGISNAALVARNAPLAGIYPNGAINEQLSIARLLWLLQQPECNLLGCAHPPCFFVCPALTSHTRPPNNVFAVCFPVADGSCPPPLAARYPRRPNDTCGS